ncbi:MAG: TetR family transcriptional regulator [Chitinophagaceae bacterium]
MVFQFKVQINEGLFIRNPEDTELGRKILKHSVQMIHQLGFEDFTFKKLAEEIHSTEAGVYRYFENKHKLLIYLTSWYFSWLTFHIKFITNNIENNKDRLSKVISLLAKPIEDDEQTSYIDESLLHSLIVAEASKSYLTKQVVENNKQHFFKPYQDICNLIGDFILAYNPTYKYPKSLASTIIEVAHFQNFFMHNISSLTDFSKKKQESQLVEFLSDLVFSSIKQRKDKG